MVVSEYYVLYRKTRVKIRYELRYTVFSHLKKEINIFLLKMYYIVYCKFLIIMV